MPNAKFKKKPIGDFAVWTKQVKKNKSAVFNNIYEHYRTLHDKDTALKYAADTFGKVLVSASLAENVKDTYSVFKHNGKEIFIPDIFMDNWVQKAEKDGIISVDLHKGNIEKFIIDYTDAHSSGLVLALDVFVAKKAGIKTNPKDPVTFRSTLIFKEDSVVFFSEKYGSQEMSLNLYYKWLNTLLSKGSLNTKTFSEMHKYAETGSYMQPSQASFDFFANYAKFVYSYLKKSPAKEAENKLKEGYPEHFVDEMDSLLKKEIEKLAELNIKVPKEAGSIAKINVPGRIMIKLPGWEQGLVGLDPDIYHLLYSETIKNRGKAPSWANKKLYDFLTKTATYFEKDASTVAPLLVSFFEYQVAKDSQAAKKVLEKEKKLKVVPKK